MAVWKNLRSATNPNSMVSNVDIQDGYIDWKIEQDEKPFLEQAKFDRDNNEMKNGHLKKFCTIPDIVAIDILSKYKLDIHDPMFMDNPMNMKRLKYIIQTDYKHLMAY